ncbi:hypothetical protein HOG21_06130 [bacterium]|jgi:nucleoside diphosphate kinase|nr:hypothetical protein [bacterium]
MKRLSKIIGHKDPSKAIQSTIRNMFSNDSLVIANKEKRIIENVIHFQENKLKMDYELKLFKKIKK